MRNGKKSKIKKRKIIIPILILAIVGGGVFSLVEKNKNENIVKVVQVSELNLSWLEPETSDYYGTLKKGSVVNYTAEKELEIENILVKKGDTVSKGDVLFTYNTKSLQFNLETAQNELKALENKITIANNELTILQRLQPSENAPDDNEEEYPEETNDVPDEKPSALEFELKITKDTKPFSGSGTQEDPYIYLADERTVFTKECLKNLEETGKYVLVYVCTPTGDVQYGRSVDGKKIDKETVSDWVCSSGVKVDPMGGVSVEEEMPFSKLVVYPSTINVLALSNQNNPNNMPENIDDVQGFDMIPEENSEPVNEDGVSPNSFTYEISDKDNYLYTRDQLNTMIADKKKEIEKFELDKKQAEINVKKANAKLSTGAEIASISGTVTFIAKDINHLSDKGYFATITSSNGMSVSSSIGEFSRDKIAVGNTVTITDYNSGNVYQGEITFIGDTPIDNSQGMDADSATESSYEFIVATSEEFEIGEESGVSIRVNRDDTPQNLIGLEMAFVREQNGKYYVLAENSQGVLEKRSVSTEGSLLYGNYVLVSSGITEDDYIAMPYGKSAEGMETVHATKDELNGLFGMI